VNKKSKLYRQKKLHARICVGCGIVFDTTKIKNRLCPDCTKSGKIFIANRIGYMDNKTYFIFLERRRNNGFEALCIEDYKNYAQ
jgi:hypothetical protein